MGTRMTREIDVCCNDRSCAASGASPQAQSLIQRSLQAPRVLSAKTHLRNSTRRSQFVLLELAMGALKT